MFFFSHKKHNKRHFFLSFFFYCLDCLILVRSLSVLNELPQIPHDLEQLLNLCSTNLLSEITLAKLYFDNWWKCSVVTIVIVPLLLPTLFGKRGIFTRSPLLWVFETFSFHLLSCSFTLFHFINRLVICVP